MNYVFDTCALIWLFENHRGQAQRWMTCVPEGATVYFHPVTLAELAAQSHDMYQLARRCTPDQATRRADYRRSMLVALGNPEGRPPWCRGRRFLRFDTATRATRHHQASVYDQLVFEKSQSDHLFVTPRHDVHVLASMVDHMILSVATFLHADDSQHFGSFVTRDRQLYEAAQRVNIPALYADPEPPRLADGRWL